MNIIVHPDLEDIARQLLDPDAVQLKPITPELRSRWFHGFKPVKQHDGPNRKQRRRLAAQARRRR